MKPKRASERLVHGGLRVRLESRLENLRLVRTLLTSLGAWLGLDEETGHAVELAVVEGVVNAIRHAHQGRPELEVELRVTATSGGLRFEIEDQGPAIPQPVWDAAARPREVDVDDVDAGDDPGGRGLFLMRQLMEHVALRPKKGGKVLVLTKRMAPSGRQ